MRLNIGLIVATLSVISSISIALNETNMEEVHDIFEKIFTTQINPMSNAWCSIEGDIGSMTYGRFSLGSGDVNGDGFDDVIADAMGPGINPSLVFLTFGRGVGLKRDDSVSNADVKFVMETPGGAKLGFGSIAGDINGDGFDDILMCDGNFNSGGKIDRGKVYLFFGKDDGWQKEINTSNADASFIGENQGDGAGWLTTGVGDLNNDSYDDFIIGAYGHDAEGKIDAGIVYIVFGRSIGWVNNEVLSSQHYSYEGSQQMEMLGWPGTGTGLGDINGDGFDDMIIGSRYLSNYSKISSKVENYLLLGRSKGWEKGGNIETYCNGSFLCTKIEDQGSMVGGRGDINGDGFNDILIGANRSDDFNGKVYLFLGKKTEFDENTNVDTADRIYLGSDTENAGTSVTIVGDLNLDGYDDIAIGAPYHSYNNIQDGNVYVINGNSTNWKGNMSLTDSDFIFFGTDTNDIPAGFNELSMAGDINGDGYPEIKVGMPQFDNTLSRYNRGKVFIISTNKASEQLTTTSIRLYPNNSFDTPITKALKGGRIFVELIGIDGNTSHIDQAFAIIETEGTESQLPLMLKETGKNTGHYRGNFTLGSCIDTLHPTCDSIPWKNITVYSRKSPNIFSKLLVQDHITLFPQEDDQEATENQFYEVKYSYRGIIEPQQWDIDLGSASSWLTWNSNKKILSGTPTNSHVGEYQIMINISDDLGHFDRHEFILTVINIPPVILTDDIEEISTGEFYYSDYNSDQDGLGVISWSYSPKVPFLEMGPHTGILSGTPTSEHTGEYHINVSVNDGNGGWDWSRFVLNIYQTNRDPSISTLDDIEAIEDDYYLISYSAYDPDGDSLNWTMKTNANWLEFNKDTRRLSGIPRNEDVGSYFVNISISDGKEGTDFHNFTLTVLNTNDKPVWKKVFNGTTLREGEEFSFQMEAFDQDSMDVLEYSISSFPYSSIFIDPFSGEISWEADTKGLTMLQNNTFFTTITVQASDGNVLIRHDFDLFIVPDPAPTARLLSPEHGKSYKSSDIVLKWEGADPEGEEVLFDLYIGTNWVEVEELKEEHLILESTVITEYKPEILLKGEEYFWTVVPKDQRSSGYCQDGVHSFHVNTPPTLTDPGDWEIDVGKKLTIELSTMDPDLIDQSALVLELVQSPDGVDLSSSTSIMTWEPGPEDIGNNTIEISVTDGKDITSITFNITVKSSTDIPLDGEGSEREDQRPVGLMLTILSLFLIICLVFFGLMVLKNRKENKGPLQGTQEDDHSEKIG